MLTPPYPELENLLIMMGEAGQYLADMKACEGSAGNISICIRWPVEVRHRFPVIPEMDLPQSVPELAGATIIVSGSGRRLREIIKNPTENLICIEIKEGGNQGIVYKSTDKCIENVTSEFNSHLAVHYDQVLNTGTNFHAVIHAQPLHLTYLSHIPKYQDKEYLNTHLLRWQPETIITLPEGIGYIPFQIPGSPALRAGNIAELRNHRIVVWEKHGVMTRSDISVKKAADRVEYAETAATYEYMNLAAGGQGEGLSVEDIREICETFSIDQNIF